MYDLRNSVQEKKVEQNPLIHPRSAPIKPDPDASAGPKGYGTNIYSMFQNEDVTKQKKIQQKAYFQELTRQINEKKEQKPSDVQQSINFAQEKLFMTSNNFSNDLPKLIQEEEKRYPRWQKKYEIENHIGINVNTSQVFGGVLQRDEAQLLKQKKEEQQKEMQLFLMRQIEEKNRKRTEEQALRRRAEVEQIEKQMVEEVPISPKKEETISQSKPESPSSKTMQVFKQEENPELKNLSAAVQKLMQEKEDLRLKITEQERQIKELHTKQTLKPERDSKSELDKEKKRPSKPRAASGQEVKLKSQHEQERVKLAVIEEKLENARKKRIEQTKLKNNPKPRRISEVQVKPETREPPSKPNRIKTAVFPVQKQTLLVDSPRVPVKPLHFEEDELREVEHERDNLDTAGKSKFIYPDANGNFCDEIDKFVNSYEKRESPLVNYKSPYRNSPVVDGDRFNFTTNSLGARRDFKPLVANKAGFPSDIFRLP